MDINKALEEIGLSEGEIKVYLALLKLGSVPVSRIKEETHLHRTTVYDFVEKLLNKGLVNYVLKGGIKHYKATTPNKLLEFVKEKEEAIKEILPEIKRLSKHAQEEISVEVHKGKEGVKTLLNDMIRTKKDWIGIGVEDTDWERVAPLEIDRYFIKEAKAGIKGKVLASEETSFIYKMKQHEYRYLPREHFNPTNTIVYGDKTAIVIWDPLTVIIIENPSLADSYRKDFRIIWKFAKLKPKKKVRKYQNI
jgi:HTH-type transcriptional regulator, sugar sensing transcriptional regulator